MQEKKNGITKKIPWAAIGILFSTFAIIVLIAVFCFSFYRISVLGKHMQEDLSLLHKQMDTVQTNAENSQRELQQSQETLKQNIASLRQSEDTDKNAWHIMEAQYYAKLADTKLQLEHNVAGAIQLLQMADKIIQGLNDAKYDPTRKALADDIAALQNAEQVDYTGIYMRILALENQVDQLPLPSKLAEKETSSSPSKATSWWKQGLSESWQTLQKIIVVRYHADGVPPLVSPDQQIFILQNLHVMFEKTLWALLNKKPEIYQSSLQQIADWIHRYGVSDNPATQSMLNQVNQLQQIDINPPMPKITASLQALGS